MITYFLSMLRIEFGDFRCLYPKDTPDRMIVAAHIIAER
jgi:hypothetical protein